MNYFALHISTLSGILGVAICVVAALLSEKHL